MKARRGLRVALFAAAGISPLAQAQTAAATGSIASGQILQMLLGLTLVLGLIFAIAWLLKRGGLRQPGSSGALRVVAGAAVGQRERVVVVEIGSTWLVVGVAPGSVRALHQMPRIEAPASSAPTPASANFAGWLRHLLEKRGEA